MMADLTQPRLKELLHYDAETGVFTWRIGPGKRARNDLIGRPAGRDSHGYIAICIGYQHYRAHRLAWFYVHGEWPSGEVDHINRNRSDNRISNLRVCATHQENTRNGSVRTRNRAGVAGVTWDAATEKWRATITIDDRQISLGRHACIAKAIAARRAAERIHFGAFAPGAAHVG